MPKATRRRSRDRAPLVIVSLFVFVPLAVEIVLAATADDRSPEDLVSGPELAADLQSALALLDIDTRGEFAKRDARAEIEISNLMRSDRRVIRMMVDAAHPMFDDVREAEGWETWRLRRAFAFATTFPSDVFLEWIRTGEPALEARANELLPSGTALGRTRAGILQEMRRPETDARQLAVYLTALRHEVRGAYQMLLEIIASVDPDRHLEGFGATCMIAMLENRGMRFEVIAEEAAPMVPRLLPYLEQPEWFKVASRILVDMGPHGQTPVMEHAASASIEDRLTIAEHFSRTPLFWGFPAIPDNQIRDAGWFQDQAQILLVPAFENGTVAEKRLALLLVTQLRMDARPLARDLAPLLRDEDFHVRDTVLAMFIRFEIAHPELDRMIATMMADENPDVVAAMIQRTNRERLRLQPRILAAVVEVAERGEARLRYLAVDFLSLCAPGAPEVVVPALAKRLADETADVRIEAANGLVRYGRSRERGGANAGVYAFARQAVAQALTKAERGLETERLEQARDALR